MPKKSVYLDYAAATPLAGQVLKAMQPYFSGLFYNPSANYLASKDIKKKIEQGRSKVAGIIGAKSSEVIFTAGGTEANNLAISGVMDHYPQANLIISAIEHPSVYAPAKSYKYQVCPVDKSGIIKLDELKKRIDDQTVLVSIILVSNEIGVIEPIKEIAALIKEIRISRLEKGNKLPIYLHSDAAQAANYLDLHSSRLGVDLMSLNGGKIYGPKQSGILFSKSNVHLKPIIEGGGQERGLRSGTENVAGIIGFCRALELAQNDRKINADKSSSLQSYFIDQIRSNFANAFINGSLSRRIANNIHVTFNGIDNERLLIKLDEAGIMAAAGSACSASSDEPSTVLKAIGLSDQEARSSIRFSIGRSTTKTDIDYVISILSKLLRQDVLPAASK